MTKLSAMPLAQAMLPPTVTTQPLPSVASSAQWSAPRSAPGSTQRPAQGVAGTTRPAPPPDPAKVAKSAQDFEAMAIGQLLQPMFDTVDTSHDMFGGGAGEEAWKPMLVQQFAKQIAAHGGLGLAKPVYEAMLRMQGNGPK
ncbi:rod-binding protein [Rhodopila sp.]|uniref:rod-binding protein n=1 Tax=Rhodopila sp. TaxID=2480087 RepID=UPI003D143574